MASYSSALPEQQYNTLVYPHPSRPWARSRENYCCYFLYRSCFLLKRVPDDRNFLSEVVRQSGMEEAGDLIKDHRGWLQLTGYKLSHTRVFKLFSPHQLHQSFYWLDRTQKSYDWHHLHQGLFIYMNDRGNPAGFLSKQLFMLKSGIIV